MHIYYADVRFENQHFIIHGLNKGYNFWLDLLIFLNNFFVVFHMAKG